MMRTSPSNIVKKGKILFVTPIGEMVGGGERSGFEFCKFLVKNGYQVITAMPQTSVTYKQALDELNMSYRLLSCGDFETQAIDGRPVFTRVVSELINIIKNDKIDIVITNLYAQYGPVAAILAGVPNISMDRGVAYVDTYFPDFMAKFSDAVVVNSMGLAAVYKERYDIVTPVVYSYTAKPEFGLNKSIKEQRIVCVARVSPEKNLLQVLEAVYILKERGVFNGKVLIIGPAVGDVEKKYKAELEEYCRSNGLEEDVKWLGNQKRPWNLVGEKDIYLNVSENESVGRSSVEAIKLEVPTIVVDIPGHKDIIEKIGVMSYGKGDTIDLADKIQYVLHNYNKVKKKAAGYALSAEELSNEENCNKDILPLLESLNKTTSVSTVDLFSHVLKGLRDSTDRLLHNETVYTNEIALRDKEIASHLGVKRSARLLLGNIKRRIIKHFISQR